MVEVSIIIIVILVAVGRIAVVGMVVEAVVSTRLLYIKYAKTLETLA